jgi:hypothetical protein
MCRWLRLAQISSPRDTARSDGSGCFGCLQANGRSPWHLHLHERTRSQGPFLHRRYPASAVLCPCPTPARSATKCDVEAATSDRSGLPRYPHHHSGVPCPLPRRTGRVRLSIASPSVLPSPFCRRVGIRISTFEACSGFTRVTARRIAQPPKAAFVTRLRSSRLPSQTARQLPEQSTIPWVVPSSTGDTRPRGAQQKSRVLHLTLFLSRHGAVLPSAPARSARGGKALT